MLYSFIFSSQASPFGKCVRRRWNMEEKNIVGRTFKNHINLQSQPSFKEIQKLKNERPDVLRDRSCAMIKAWVNNQMKKQKN